MPAAASICAHQLLSTDATVSAQSFDFILSAPGQRGRNKKRSAATHSSPRTVRFALPNALSRPPLTNALPFKYLHGRIAPQNELFCSKEQGQEQERTMFVSGTETRNTAQTSVNGWCGAHSLQSCHAAESSSRDTRELVDVKISARIKHTGTPLVGWESLVASPK